MLRYLEDLYAYGMVVRHRGFTAAAQAMHTSKSALSKRVARLEDHLGGRLIERSARGFRVTELGEQIASHAESVMGSAEEVERAARMATSAPRGTLRIACPPGLLHTAVADVLAEFASAHPQVRLAVTVSNRTVDLVEEPFDFAIRARERLDSEPSLVVRKLGTSRRILVAAPTYLKTAGRVRDPQDLPQQQLLTLAEDVNTAEWTLFHSEGEKRIIRFAPRFVASEFGLVNRAAIAGTGIGLVTEPVCRAHIAAGALQHVLPDWHAPEAVVHVAFTSRRGLLPATRAAIDYLASRLPDRL